MGPRSPKRVAVFSAVCWGTLPPLASHFTPSQSTENAQHHDDGMWKEMGKFLGGLTRTEEQKLTAWHLASLPMRLGGLGLRSARPPLAHNVVDGLNGAQEVEGCINCAMWQSNWIVMGSLDAQLGPKSKCANMESAGLNFLRISRSES